MSNTSNTSETQNSREKHESMSESDETEEVRESADERPSPMQVLRHARTQLAELTGMAPESVSSFEQSEDGWTLEVEVLEIARVPDTMSLLASYRVELDPRGELTGYRRVRRYERGRADPHRR
ncbi:gas vesicle protein [Streptomyces caniscabiei]|uniref:Gas vesicle protein n=2 Tax=Streptomyces caniscabiei TaxID=2746961 RepID=A0A927QCQ3_9ACTN|nr:gas vesicle protein [Streptomyces caniscabiei]MBD9721843.1 gas vesicle protein [Streptomyces caniscabiei]MDX3509035.1 gas vesicle protein [Streptomyces caniscabiei]MDX3717212.1 gas vesicle protein [Streptomyces caniscabiei]WEO29852.1 gas vesicle protein [Streptomyces caniscabiei]